MRLYRVKQFFWGITAEINLEDREFIRTYLNDDELKLFEELPKYEQAHCIRTAKNVHSIYSDKKMSNNLLIKAALLHDIGKIEKKLNLIDKSVLVVLDKITKGKMKKFSNIDKINIYYNHGDKGYNILKQYCYDERLLYLVKNHHNHINGDKELEILRECDSKS